MKNLVDFTKKNGSLVIKLLPEGREFLKGKQDAENWKKGTNPIFLELIEYQLSNGWDLILPEDICALTSSLILSDEAEYNNTGELVKIGRVYWFPDYAVVCELEVLLEKGEITFKGVD
jgi:hypothetical protein